MLPLLLLLPVPALALSQTHGVPPSLSAAYTPSAAGTWKCLNWSKSISWTAVNDDYCDCPDGSDEPGTAACKDTQFYCANEGHISAMIPSSRVHDGLCEAECCDGSDEREGVCPNVCKQVGAAHRTKVDAERKLRKTGAKIRSTYIAFAQKEKKRLEGVVVSTSQEIGLRQKEVDRLRDVLARTESLSAADLEFKKQSPLYKSLTAHSAALASLQKAHQQALDRETQLGDILDALRSGYNPNYQDMAVLEAVRGWEALAGLPHINDVRKDDEAATDAAPIDASAAPEEEVEEYDKNKVDALLRADYQGLLIEHERHVSGSGSDSLLFNIEAYLPEAAIPYFENGRDTLLGWLQTLGLARPAGDASAASTKARQNLNDAEKDLKAAKSEHDDAVSDLESLFSPEKFGRLGEWKKLEDNCLEKDAGEYTYEICLFKESTQRPNHGGSSHSLGRFSGWNTAAPVGTPEYYSKQMYTNGAKCWNGPSRSVTLLLTCGTENALLSVAEPEKCEYEITGTSPALCLPLELEGAKDEL